MPLYEYECQSCEERFEFLARSWNDEVTCPACQASDVEKQLSTFALGGGRSPGGGCGCGRGGCGCRA